jgi:hypothetical protein
VSLGPRKRPAASREQRPPAHYLSSHMPHCSLSYSDHVGHAHTHDGGHGPYKHKISPTLMEEIVKTRAGKSVWPHLSLSLRLTLSFLPTTPCPFHCTTLCPFFYTLALLLRHTMSLSMRHTISPLLRLVLSLLPHPIPFAVPHPVRSGLVTAPHSVPLTAPHHAPLTAQHCPSHCATPCPSHCTPLSLSLRHTLGDCATQCPSGCARRCPCAHVDAIPHVHPNTLSSGTG